MENKVVDFSDIYHLNSNLHKEVIYYTHGELIRLTGIEGKNYDDLSQKIIMRILDFVDEMIGEGMINEKNRIEAISYNIPFWTQALIKNIDADLRFDRFDQVEYPYQKNAVVSITKNVIIDRLFALLPTNIAWQYLLINYSDIGKQFDELLRVLEVGNHKKVIFLSNHATWLNLPLIAFFLIRSGIVGHDELYTILAPAIMATHSTLAGAVREGGALKSWANTKRGNTVFEQKKTVLKAFLRALDSKNTMERIFYILSPSGTTDKNIDGKIILGDPTDGTISLLKKLEKEGFTFVSIGINDLEVMSGNSKLRRGKVFIDYDIHTDPNIALTSLSRNVIDSSGKRIGKWLSEPEYE